jgi:phage host-nuclease inhibitor protein Gam
LFSQIEALHVTSQQEIEDEYQAYCNEITKEFTKSQKIHEESLTALSFFWMYGKASINSEETNNVFDASYKAAVKEETARFASLVSEHEAVLEALSLDRDAKLVALSEFMNTQIQTVENQYDADIQAIDAAVKKIINEVNSDLRSCLKSVDSSRKGMAINGMLLIGAACAVFAAPALLTATAGNLAVGAVQVSAATTGLGAANNLFNNNDAVGVTFTFNLSNYTPKPYVAPAYKVPSLQKDVVLPDNHLSGMDLNLFSNNRINGSYSNAYTVTQPKTNISFASSEHKQANYKTTRVEHKQIPITKTGAHNWSRMAWRAIKQDKSPEVINWQQNNRNRFPKTAAFFDSIANSKSQRLVNAFADEFAGRPVMFVEQELSLIKQSERTQTAEFIANTAEALKDAQEFIVQDAARFITGDTTKTEIFFEMVGNFACIGKYVRSMSTDNLGYWLRINILIAVPPFSAKLVV